MNLKTYLKETSIIAFKIAILILLIFSNISFAKTLIRFATIAPEGSAWMETMHAIDKELSEQSGGEVSFKFYPNMSMGDEKDVIRKIRLGQLNGAGFTGNGLGEILPELRILELPYLFKNEAEIDYVVSELTPYFEQKLADRGFILLGWADIGWVYFLSNEPVVNPDDLKEQNVWSWAGDPLADAFFKELDNTPIPLSITDVHMSLQTGLINTVYCSPLAALVMQWFTKVKYISDIPFTNAIGAVLIDRKTFDKLESDQKAFLLKSSQKHMRELLLKSRKDNSEAYQYLTQEGLEVTISTDEQRKAMREVSIGVYNRLADDLYSRELLERLLSILAEYRSIKPPQK